MLLTISTVTQVISIVTKSETSQIYFITFQLINSRRNFVELVILRISDVTTWISIVSRLTLVLLHPNTIALLLSWIRGGILYLSLILEPEKVAPPLPISALEDRKQVNMKVFRVSERLGKIRQYYMMVSPWHLTTAPLDMLLVDEVKCLTLHSLFKLNR